MDVRAIVLTGCPGEPKDHSGCFIDSEKFAGVPLVLLPVLGQPVLHRIIDHLQSVGIDSCSVLNAADRALPAFEDAGRADIKWQNVSSNQLWRAAEEEFDEMARGGAELVLLLRLGAYAEVELDPLLQFHLDQRNHTTQVVAADGPLDFFVLSGSRRNDAAFLLRNKLQKMRVQTRPFVTGGYVNPLQTAADLRRLTLDSLLQKTSIQPQGVQFRPGVWLGQGARIDRNVRLVAPCYVGPYARIRSGSLITRGSSVEHHSIVDCGTVVEASTLLPLSYLGTGLDLVHSIVGFNRIASVKHAAELDMEDKSLVSIVPASSIWRTLHHASRLVTFVPHQMLLKLFGGRKTQTALRPCPEDVDKNFDPRTVARPVAQDCQPLAPTVVTRMREYGNQ
jgi:NDP-sugar pyrophosphorylase family protein